MARKIFGDEKYTVGIDLEAIVFFNYSKDGHSLTVYMKVEGNTSLHQEFIYGEGLTNKIYNFLMENWEDWSEIELDDSEPK